jgi:hypothetical protein
MRIDIEEALAKRVPHGPERDDHRLPEPHTSTTSGGRGGPGPAALAQPWCVVLWAAVTVTQLRNTHPGRSGRTCEPVNASSAGSSPSDAWPTSGSASASDSSQSVQNGLIRARQAPPTGPTRAQRSAAKSRANSSTITPGNCRGTKWVADTSRSRAPGTARAACLTSRTSTSES